MPYGVEINRLASLWAAQPTNTCFAALAEALRKHGALDDAAAVAAAGVAARPEYLPGHLVMARVHRDRQNWEAAQAEFQVALSLDPGHPVVLDARDDLAHMLAPHPFVEAENDDPSATVAAADASDATHDDEADDMVYVDVDEDPVDSPAAEPVLTESLAMLYRGQGHLEQALDVLDALVARRPDDPDLVVRRDAMRAEADIARPRPYDASRSGGLPVRSWLSSLATAHAPVAPAASPFDAFYQAPVVPASEDGDLAAFQAWLRELER